MLPLSRAESEATECSLRITGCDEAEHYANPQDFVEGHRHPAVRIEDEKASSVADPPLRV